MPTGGTPRGLAWELEAALAAQGREPDPTLAAAYGWKARKLEQALINVLWSTNEPLEHGGRLYAIGEDGRLRVTVPWGE